MDEQAFAQFLKKSGKKAHVIEGLVGQVREFERHLDQGLHKGLNETQPQDLQDYFAAVEAAQPGKGKIKLRGLALFYRFTGKHELASSASALRAGETAKTRKIFALKDFRGIDAEHLARLEAVGISNVEHMLARGETPQARDKLAETSGVPAAAILELVKLADLARIQGLKGIRARLYHDAGADTPEVIAQWEPGELLKMLAEFVQQSNFAGIPPLPKEVEATVHTARRLPKLIQY